jgi:hypothetical protein
MHRYPSPISHLPSPRPMSHPCLNDRRAGRPGSPRTQGRQRGQHPARLRGQHFVQYSTFTQERHRQGRKSLYNLPHGSAHRREALCSTAKTILLERRPPAMSSPGSQSVSALHLLLAFEQGGLPPVIDLGDRAARKQGPSLVCRDLCRAALPGPGSVSASHDVQGMYHQVSRDRCSAPSDLSCKIFAPSC